MVYVSPIELLKNSCKQWWRWQRKDVNTAGQNRKRIEAKWWETNQWSSIKKKIICPLLMLWCTIKWRNVKPRGNIYIYLNLNLKHWFLNSSVNLHMDARWGSWVSHARDPFILLFFILICFIMDRVHAMQVYSSGIYVFTRCFFFVLFCGFFLTGEE